MHGVLKTWLHSELVADEAKMKVLSLHFDLQGVKGGWSRGSDGSGIRRGKFLRLLPCVWFSSLLARGMQRPVVPSKPAS